MEPDENREFDDNAEGNQLSTLVEWLNGMMPHLHLPLEASEEKLRACLADGTVLFFVLNKLSPDSVQMGASFEPGPANVKRFLAAIDDMGLPRFELSDLEQGNMSPVLQCLTSLRASFCFSDEEDTIQDHSRKGWNVSRLDEFPDIDGDIDGDERHWDSLGSKFQQGLHSFVTSEESALMHHLAHTSHDVLQLKERGYTDVSDVKILEFVNSSCVYNASTKSLFGIVNRILDECVERKNGDVPHRMACLLGKVVQLIEKQTATQYQNFKNQNNLFRAREEKYKLRIRVLETLTVGTTEEIQVVVNQLEQIMTERTEIEQKKKLEEQSTVRLKKESDHRDIEISTLKQEFEMAKREHELHRLQLEEQIHETKVESQKKLEELKRLLTDSRKKVEELKSLPQRWKWKKHSYTTAERQKEHMDYMYHLRK